MGDFRITIEAVGGHGCGRGSEIDAQKVALPTKGLEGFLVTRCHRDDCVDCMTIDLIERLKRKGVQVAIAKLEHWPVPPAARQPGSTWEREEKDKGPVDNLLDGVRDRPWR